MSTLVVALAIILGLILFVILSASIGLLRSWRALPQRVQQEYHREMHAHRTTILALGALALLPALIYLLILINVFPLPVSAVGLLLWAGVAIWFRERRVKPLHRRD